MDNLLGVDVSHWQGAMNWSKAAINQVHFAFIKCTQGIDFFDSRFTENWTGAGAARIWRGAYHWLEPELDPVDQADWFVDHFGTVQELEPVVDVEDSDNIPPDYETRLLIFLSRIEERTGGYRPIIYTRSSYWKVYLPNALWADAYKLWVANYREDSGPLVSLPWAPNRWWFWQFTSSANGPKYGASSQEIDLDVSNGELVRAAVPTAKLPPVGLLPSGTFKPLRATYQDYLEEARWKLRKNPRKD